MNRKEHKVYYKKGKVDDLDPFLRTLSEKAKSASQTAYAPYSEFKVGAAVALSNGEVITGSNQENASYPAGLCAERVAIFYAHSNYPDEKIKTVAIHAPVNDQHIIPSPCGNCRQVIAEFRNIQAREIEILLTNSKSQYWLFNDILDLLPFDFNALHLSR